MTFAAPYQQNKTERLKGCRSVTLPLPLRSRGAGRGLSPSDMKGFRGKVGDREVDFVVQGDDGRIIYIQVAVSVADEEKLKQELAVFEAIKDNYPKYLLTLDDVFVADHNGIRTLNIIDFLLERKDIVQ